MCGALGPIPAPQIPWEPHRSCMSPMESKRAPASLFPRGTQCPHDGPTPQWHNVPWCPHSVPMSPCCPHRAGGAELGAAAASRPGAGAAGRRAAAAGGADDGGGPPGGDAGRGHQHLAPAAGRPPAPPWPLPPPPRGTSPKAPESHPKSRPVHLRDSCSPPKFVPFTPKKATLESSQPPSPPPLHSRTPKSSTC